MSPGSLKIIMANTITTQIGISNNETEDSELIMFTDNLDYLVVASVLLAILALFIIFVNVIVFIALNISKSHRNSNPGNLRITKLLMMSMAVSDAIVGAFSLPFTIYQVILNAHWDLGSEACIALYSLDAYLCTVSIYHVMCMSIEKYLAICRPLVHRKLSSKNGYIMIALCWTVAGSMFFIISLANDWTETREKNVCFAMSDFSTLHIVLSGLMSLYLPLGITMLVYVRIFLEIRRFHVKAKEDSALRKHQYKSDGKLHKEPSSASGTDNYSSQLVLNTTNTSNTATKISNSLLCGKYPGRLTRTPKISISFVQCKKRSFDCKGDVGDTNKSLLSRLVNKFRPVCSQIPSESGLSESHQKAIPLKVLHRSDMPATITDCSKFTDTCGESQPKLDVCEVSNPPCVSSAESFSLAEWTYASPEKVVLPSSSPSPLSLPSAEALPPTSQSTASPLSQPVVSSLPSLQMSLSSQPLTSSLPSLSPRSQSPPPTQPSQLPLSLQPPQQNTLSPPQPLLSPLASQSSEPAARLPSSHSSLSLPAARLPSSHSSLSLPSKLSPSSQSLLSLPLKPSPSQLSLSSLQSRSTPGTGRKHRLLTGNTKAVLVIGLMVLSFTACWLPFSVFLVLSDNTKNTYPLWSLLVLNVLGYLNSALNPVLYCCHKSIRKAVRSFICPPPK